MLKRFLSAGLAAVMIVFVVMVMTTSADSANGQKKGFQFNPENRQAVMQAIGEGDYDEWYSLMTVDGRNPKILEAINKDNFSKFVQMHDYINKANEIREELGLTHSGIVPMDKKNFRGHGIKGMNSNNNHHEGVLVALENDDYDKFMEAMTENGNRPKMLEYVTEDNFSKFVHMHELLKEKKFDEAKSIAAEIGLPNPGMGMMKNKFGQWKKQ